MSQGIKKVTAELLANHALHAPTTFLELIAHPQTDEDDDDGCFDEDGDCVHAADSFQLMSKRLTVRVFIPTGTDRLMAIRQLKKLTKWLKRCPDVVV